MARADAIQFSDRKDMIMKTTKGRSVGLAPASLVLIAAGPAFAQVMGDSPGAPARGPQRPAANARPARPNRSHLDLLLKVTRSGAVEVVRVSELPGEPVLSDSPAGRYVYEASRGEKAVAAEAMIDPFESRSFPGAPGSGLEGHHIGEAETAFVTVKVPGTTLAEAMRDGLSVRLYRLETDRQLERMDLAEVSRLKDQRELK